MPDSDDGEIEPRRRDEIEDENDTGPLLSFDFEESPMPHWSEPGSGERPEGGERPDPPEVDSPLSGGSRLFPQLPDDPHLVDTSDTGLMDAVRSDTIPTVPPGTQDGPSTVGSAEVIEPDPVTEEEGVLVQASEDGDFSQPQVPTDELFNDTLFDDDFDESLFDDSPIIGRTGVDEDDAPVFDTGPIEEVAEDVFEPSDDPLMDVEAEEVALDESEPDENERPMEAPLDQGNQDPSVGTVFEDEPTAELILDEPEPLTETEIADLDQSPLPEIDDDSLPESESESVDEPERSAPRVIELFDTPPSQRIMQSSPRADLNLGEEDNDGHEDAEWSEFGGPAPHWREGRRDYEESTKVTEDDRTVTHGSDRGEGSSGSSGSTGRNLPAAIGVGLALAAAFFGLLKVGPWAILIMVLAALGLAALEFFTSAQNLGYRPATLLGLAAVIGLSLGAYHRGFEAYPVVFALLVVTGMCWFLFDVDSQHVTANFAVTLLGFAWVGGLGSFAALILARPNGDAILIGAVIGTIAYDVGGYVIGSTTGQSKIAPRVSPNKTYEGLLGGMMLSVVVTTLVLNRFPGIHPWSISMMDCFWLGLAIALIAPVGDLAQSMIKRDMGVKDMGTLLPGHGGAFDRFDALLFVLPTAYFVADLVLN